MIVNVYFSLKLFWKRILLKALQNEVFFLKNEILIESLPKRRFFSKEWDLYWKPSKTKISFKCFKSLLKTFRNLKFFNGFNWLLNVFKNMDFFQWVYVFVEDLPERSSLPTDRRACWSLSTNLCVSHSVRLDYHFCLNRWYKYFSGHRTLNGVQYSLNSLLNNWLFLFKSLKVIFFNTKRFGFFFRHYFQLTYGERIQFIVNCVWFFAK